MMLNHKKGSFVIREHNPVTPAVLANVIDRRSLVEFWGQKNYEDVTDRLRRSNVMKNPSDKIQPTPFTDWLVDTGRTIETTESNIRYRHVAKGKVSFKVQKTTSYTHPGLFFEPFDIILNTDVFKDGDRIRPEDAPMQQLVVMGSGQQVGLSTKYTVKYATRNRSAFFNPKWLVAGTRFCKAGSSVYSERSANWGSTLWDHGKSVLVYQVPLFKTGKEIEITDDALNHVFMVDTVDKDGNAAIIDDKPQSAISAAELNFMSEVAWEKEQDLIWGVAANHIEDTSTHKKRQIGAGILDFLRDGHVYRYSPYNFAIREITDFLRTVWRMGPGMIVFGTGMSGLELIDKAIRKEFSALNVISKYEDYVEKGGTVVPGGVDAWKLKKPMFNAYELPGWGVVVFERWAALDNMEMRGPRHPITGEPLLALNFIGTRYNNRRGIQSNVTLVRKKGAYIWTYIAGVVGPNGAINDKNGGQYRATHAGRFCTLHHGDGYGSLIDNINDFVWFLPAIR